LSRRSLPSQHERAFLFLFFSGSQKSFKPIDPISLSLLSVLSDEGWSGRDFCEPFTCKPVEVFMCIKCVEVVDYDKVQTINDEISPISALYVICRCYLACGGKITSVTDTTMVVEVFTIRPEVMTLTGDFETMAFLRRAAEAINWQTRQSHVYNPVSADDMDGTSYALHGWARAHSGEDRALAFLLTGAGIVNHDEVKAMKSLRFNDALSAYVIREAVARENIWTLKEIIHVVQELSSFLRSCQPFELGKWPIEVQDLVNFAVNKQLNVMNFLVECLESMARGGGVDDLTRAYLPKAA
jgi:hypothetical protein